MRIFLIALIVIVGALYALFELTASGFFGETVGGGEVAGGPRPTEVTVERIATQQQSMQTIGEEGTDQILFGDLHVHSTFSPDAFAGSLPMVQGEGAHPVSDACDFARYCSNLDFWSITDHGIGMTPRKWTETKRVVRACNARAGGGANPDMVTYLGWEWTQIGTTAENHYGHKNVILKDTEDDKVPSRPIAAKAIPGSLPYGADKGIPKWQRAFMAVAAPGGNRDAYLKATGFMAELAARPICEEGKSVHELPTDCLETAPDPATLFAKLDEWGFPTLVIPHGTTWGFYTPPGVSLDKQLAAKQDDPNVQRMVEIYSGHGNSEVYRDWRAVKGERHGEYECPEPVEGYLPMCWRAGEIIRERCLAEGLVDEAECDARAVKARKYAANGGVSGFQTVGGFKVEEWLDAGQCRDCWEPAFNYRPGNSAQYALAITNFDDPEVPRRFHWGFMASSDNHQARPGTGYKEMGRRGMTESIALAGLRQPFGPPPDPVSDPVLIDPINSPLRNFELTETERQGSFYFTGGLVAVHAPSRDREAIWKAINDRHVYGTSGTRMLLWFDLINAGFDADTKMTMGSLVAQNRNPVFRVAALGSFEQKPGCPDYAADALGPDDVARICLNECYNPSDVRKRIEQIEIIRVRPQISPDEKVADLIEDPWKVITCDPSVPTDEGCVAEFDDPDYADSGRPATYYARAIEEPQPTVNGNTISVERDEAGKVTGVKWCSGNYKEHDVTDDCLAEQPAKAWSSPIYLEPAVTISAGAE